MTVKLIISTPIYVHGKDIPIGHICRDEGGTTCYRSGSYMIQLCNGNETPVTGLLNRYSDLGRLQIEQEK